MSRNPELLVPIRDRRRGKRILTLKNLRNVTLVAIALFVALTVVSRVRGPKTHDDYGRLFGDQVKAPETAVKHRPEVVTEGSIDDQDHADPMLVGAAARAQYLGVEPNSITPAPAVPVESTPAPQVDVTHATIVGDANGVTIAKTDTQSRGVLGGGIFKQQ